MLNFTVGYMAKGSTALGTLNDKEPALPLRGVFEALLKVILICSKQIRSSHYYEYDGSIRSRIDL